VQQRLTMQDQGQKPGQKVPKSGVYVVRHEKHRADHEVTMTRDDHFPECAVCGAAVRFHLVHAASAIEADADFRKRRRAHGA
jgi:hypothetical protein